MSLPVRTAVFPVAGRGTRFLPATKAMPKEMLPIVDKPLIQYAVDEAIAAGAERLVFITGSSKRAIEDHFDVDPELERELEEAGKHELLAVIRETFLPNDVPAIRAPGRPARPGPRRAVRPAGGRQRAVLRAPAGRPDLQRGTCLQQMRVHFERHGASVLAVETFRPIRPQLRHRRSRAEKSARCASIVEKPKPADAPSNLAVVGRYILTPAIFAKLERTQRGAGGEIQLTDGIAALLKREPVYVLPFAGRRYDCGSKLGYIEAIVDFAMDDPALRKPLQAHMAAYR